MRTLEQVYPEQSERLGVSSRPETAHVVVVDDDPTIRGYVAEVLEEEGYRVDAAGDGAVALEILARCARHGMAQPSLILLDMRMPVMDGWAFAAAYRELPVRHAPIVVVTAAHDAAARAAQVRADDVLPKPFDLDDLLAIVERYAGPGRA